jgi:hypothetical protein
VVSGHTTGVTASGRTGDAGEAFGPLTGGEPALDNLQEKGMYPAGRIVRGIVAEFMGLPEDHPAVARGCVSVAAPFLMLLICDRRTLEGLFPHLGIDPRDTEALIRHLVQFTLAGLTAIAADAQRKT